jgi:hypothetical protein
MYDTVVSQRCCFALFWLFVYIFPFEKYFSSFRVIASCCCFFFFSSCRISSLNFGVTFTLPFFFFLLLMIIFVLHVITETLYPPNDHVSSTTFLNLIRGFLFVYHTFSYVIVVVPSEYGLHYIRILKLINNVMMEPLSTPRLVVVLLCIRRLRSLIVPI